MDIAKQSDLQLIFHNTVLQRDLINIILKYTEPSIIVEFENSDLIYCNNLKFNLLNCKVINIYGVLVLTNPRKIFENSRIQNINGSVVLIGDASGMFYDTSNFLGTNICNWDTSQVTNMGAMFSYCLMDV
jgi:surface protein